MAPSHRNSNSEEKRTLTNLLIGPARDIRDPRLFHSLSLIAFLAWIGLGSDGLSSSCYGPEQAFIALGSDRYLTIVLALIMATTVFVISISYSQIIDLFPSGGGGYLVATRLLGRYPGLVSGCALIVDYVLTIAISIASGADAIFSFFPGNWLAWKLEFCLVVVVLIIAMNLRGVKESVVALVPIFLSFMLLHVFMIVYAFVSRSGEIPTVLSASMHQARSGLTTLGALPLAIVLMRAYSLGGGTYTGIEAVSNGLPILREPRTVTGKRTMAYMAVSLAFISAGLLTAYLLLGVAPKNGMTLNAVLFNRLVGSWSLYGLRVGAILVTVTLFAEGALLFVAAQTGFIGGPQVLATMASGRWLPRRFASLSTRLVTQDGIIAMGVAAGGIVLGTGARVETLVVLYAINVFITFTLSQLGVSVHWWRARSTDFNWKRKFAINSFGCLLTASILVATTVLKFNEGGWFTITLTGGVIALCLAVRRHYEHLDQVLKQLEANILPQMFAAERKAAPPFEPEAPTAVLLVNGFSGLGLSMLVSLPHTFKGHFRNVVFLSVGEFDAALLRGPHEIHALEQSIRDDLQEYANFAADLGFHADLRMSIGADVVEELHGLSLEVARDFPNPVFFAGRLVFEREERFFTRFLHNQTALELLKRLQPYGLSLVVIPVQVGASSPKLRLIPGTGARLREA
jgi:amino acid transporter